MKRILLTTLLLSFAAQAPVHATESKVLAMLIKPEYKQKLMEVGNAIAADTQMIASQSGSIVKGALAGAETTLRMPFVALNRGTKGFAQGLEYIGKNHPLVGAAASATLCVASFKKANHYDKQYNQGDKTFLCVISMMATGLATMVYSCMAINKYTNI